MNLILALSLFIILPSALLILSVYIWHFYNNIRIAIILQTVFALFTLYILTGVFEMSQVCDYKTYQLEVAWEKYNVIYENAPPSIVANVAHTAQAYSKRDITEFEFFNALRLNAQNWQDCLPKNCIERRQIRLQSSIAPYFNQLLLAVSVVAVFTLTWECFFYYKKTSRLLLCTYGYALFVCLYFAYGGFTTRCIQEVTVQLGATIDTKHFPQNSAVVERYLENCQNSFLGYPPLFLLNELQNDE